MTGSKHLSSKQCDELPDRIKAFITMTSELEELKKKHAEFMGRLANDLGVKKIAINWGGGKILESDGRRVIEITENNIEIVA